MANARYLAVICTQATASLDVCVCAYDIGPFVVTLGILVLT